MNERLIIRLTEEGRHLPINSLSNDGVTLKNETDATPREVLFEFDGDGTAMKTRLDWVRSSHGWNPREFKLERNLSDGNLSFTGVDFRAFPEGLYWFRLTIADLNLPKERIRVEIPKDGAAEVEVKVKKDKRTVRLTSNISAFDPDVRRVVEAIASRVDGLTASEWLASRQPRPRRKACFLNILARLRAAPTVSNHLLRHIQHVFYADVDRIYARVDGELLTRLEELARDPSKPFIEEGSPKSAGHRRLLDRVAQIEGGAHTSYRLKSFRQEGSNGLQAVVAAPTDDPGRNYYADLDIDLGNPLEDLAGFIVHMGELIAPGKTDHLALRGKLGKLKSVAPFLFYEVVENS
ncbi:MAG TPA: hypothetical protein VJ842_01430 [Pyrinomonadaceae bacterium]|nr:hypothetical protein [Pyrinomonadaceae bacterium]